MGIEPTRPAWKAGILPLNYTRISTYSGTVSLYRLSHFTWFVNDFSGEGKFFIPFRLCRGRGSVPALPSKGLQLFQGRLCALFGNESRP